MNITGSAQNLTTLLGLGAKLAVQDLIIRAASGNAGRLWIGKNSGLTTLANQIAYLDAREAWGWNLSGQWLWTDDVWLIADTPGDDAFITLIS